MRDSKMLGRIKIPCMGLLAAVIVLESMSPAAASATVVSAATEDDVVTLRVCNWEEYIDLGGWDEFETIDLESGDIIGVNAMYDDFEEWYYETYGQRVQVEYSCFGTNEDLYNMLTLGDEYDLVCPSEYMIMKLMAEGWLEPYSEDFFDEDVSENYYIRGVSPFIRETFENNEIGGEPWAKYAAGYMWGVTGILYNPDELTKEEASTWKVIDNEKFKQQVTIKDNVRDALFAAVGAMKSDLLTSEEFVNNPDYHENLVAEMNDVSPETIEEARTYLQDVKNNVYSFETDSGKADMVTGKVLASYQWSGDAVYAMDQAEEDDYMLNFAVPVESTNLYFDGWVMLKKGLASDARKQHAAEAFVNFLSMPENVVRNMYYIGYTSVIAGGDSDVVFEYADWCYSAEDETDTVAYPLGYFFSGDNADEDYVLTVDREQLERQMAAQYPSLETMEKSAIMQYFDEQENAAINQMWIDVRCLDIRKIPVWAWGIAVIIILLLLVIWKKGRKYTV